MNRPLSLVLLVVLVGTTVFYWPKAPQEVSESAEAAEFVPEYRAKLYAEQEEAYRGRYAMMDALTDLSTGTPKMLLSGLPRTFEEEWRTIMKERFGVETEFVAGCESSALLANYVAAYNAEIKRYISSEFGLHALDESYEDAQRIHDEKN